MKRIIAAAFLLIGMPDALRALDLTPHEMAQSGDGPPMKRYFFQDEGKRLSFRIDSKMAISGGGGSVGFRFVDLKGAAMKMSRSQMNPALKFDEKNLVAYRSLARTLLASDATNVQPGEEKPDAISINGWTSHQFTFTYDRSGVRFCRSITILNYNETEQFIIDVTSEAPDYEKAYARGYRVLNSLSSLPVDPAGPT